MFLLCHPWFTTTNLFYRFPTLETSATALCGTTDTVPRFSNIQQLLVHVLFFNESLQHSSKKGRVMNCHEVSPSDSPSRNRVFKVAFFLSSKNVQGAWNNSCPRESGSKADSPKLDDRCTSTKWRFLGDPIGGFFWQKFRQQEAKKHRSWKERTTNCTEAIQFVGKPSTAFWKKPLPHSEIKILPYWLRTRGKHMPPKAQRQSWIKVR